MNSFRKVFLLTAICCLSVQVHAGTGTHGGDPYVVDFLRDISRACAWFGSAKPDPKLDPAGCKSIHDEILASLNKNKKALLTSTDKQLLDQNGDPKPALFNRSSSSIQFNWKEWKDSDDLHQFTMAATEVSGLMGSKIRYSLADKVRGDWEKIKSLPGLTNADLYSQILASANSTVQRNFDTVLARATYGLNEGLYLRFCGDYGGPGTVDFNYALCAEHGRSDLHVTTDITSKTVSTTEAFTGDNGDTVEITSKFICKPGLFTGVDQEEEMFHLSTTSELLIGVLCELDNSSLSINGIKKQASAAVWAARPSIWVTANYSSFVDNEPVTCTGTALPYPDVDAYPPIIQN